MDDFYYRQNLEDFFEWVNENLCAIDASGYSFYDEDENIVSVKTFKEVFEYWEKL